MKEERKYRVIKTLKPGDPGTGNWQKKYPKLFRVRDYYDKSKNEYFKTVEIIVKSEKENYRNIPHNKLIHIRVDEPERDMMEKLINMGFKYNFETNCFSVPFSAVQKEDLFDRIQDEYIILQLASNPKYTHKIRMNNAVKVQYEEEDLDDFLQSYNESDNECELFL